MELTKRKPAVAGLFYPASKKRLHREVKELLENVPKTDEPGTLKALIVPHAGYGYSGQVAAFAFARLSKWNENRDHEHNRNARIILFGPAHTMPVDEPVTDGNAWWETPLGQVPVYSEGYPILSEAHAHEHCLEVEVPFLQEILKDFMILPIVAGKTDPEAMAERLIPLLDENTILLISTDLSHYHDDHTARVLDMTTINAIRELDITKFTYQGNACGKVAILTVLAIAKKLGWRCSFLDYRNSGDVSGQHDRVVGYASFAFYA